MVYFICFQDKILEELDKDDSTHDSVSPESDSEEDGIHIDKEKALAEKEKVKQHYRCLLSTNYLWKSNLNIGAVNFLLKIAH